jgi:hypothetical protein
MTSSTADKHRELFRSFMCFEGIEASLIKSKSAKKIKSNHTRTQSFKSPSSSKMRCLQSLDQFLGIKKHSLKKPLKKDSDESKSKQSTIKTKAKLRQIGDIADITSRIVKLASVESDRAVFEQSVLQMFYMYHENTINIAKAEMLTILKYIFGYFSGDTVKKKSVGVQTDPLNLEAYKQTAKRLVCNSDLKPPTDPLENNIVMLYQKEVLLDEILTILNEEDIDLNNLLSITLERIEANFYEPPSDMSINDGVSLTLEDKTKMPTPKAKWADPTMKNRLMIDLTKIDQVESESDRNKNPRGAEKAAGTQIDLDHLRQIKDSTMKNKQAQKVEAVMAEIQQHQQQNRRAPSEDAEDGSSFLQSKPTQGLNQVPKKADIQPKMTKKPQKEEVYTKPFHEHHQDKWSA